jgi:phospholipase/carboxylesterase/glyoxalase family protein
MSTNAQPFSDFIHRFIPAETHRQEDEPSPTLLLLHGTGGNENDLLDLGHMLLPAAARLSPRGRVLENTMPRFFRRLAEGIFDIPDLQARTYELADFVQAASQHYRFDPQRVIAVGFSNGANIAASMLFLCPSVLAGAVLFHPMVPFVPSQLPDLAHTPIFISAGRVDPIVSTGQTEQLGALLRECGADVTIHWHDGGHVITQHDVHTARVWLHNAVTVAKS